MRRSVTQRVAGIAAIALIASLVGVSGLATSASAAPAGTLTLSGPTSAPDDTDATVTATLVDDTDAPIPGVAVMVRETERFMPEWSCTTLADGTCSVDIRMTVSRSIVANTDPSGAYAGITSNGIAIARTIPTDLSIVRVMDAVVEADQQAYGLNATLVEENSRAPIGGQTVTLTRTDVEPDLVLTGVTDNRGEYYIAPIASPNATWVASFAGNTDAQLLSSTSDPWVLSNAVRTPIITTPNYATTSTINQGQTVKVEGKVARFDLTPVSGLTMELWANETGKPAFKVATTTSDVDGLFSHTDTPHRSVRYQWRHPEGGGYIAGDSGTTSNKNVVVRLASALSIVTAPPTTIASGNELTVVAHLQDAYGEPIAGKSVSVQRSGGGSIDPNSAITDASGDAAITFEPSPALTNAPLAYVVSYAGSTSGVLATAATSPTFSVFVTYTSSLSGWTSNPTPFRGQATTISGSISIPNAGPVGRSIELWASALGADWTKVTTVQLGPSPSSYSVTPTVETAYQWRFVGDSQVTASISDSVLITPQNGRQTVMSATASTGSVTVDSFPIVRATFRRADGVPDSTLHNFQLWQRVGTGAWTRVTTQTITGSSPSAYVSPQQRTSYQWRYAGAIELAASSSNIVTISVRPAVAVQFEEAEVARGKRTGLVGSIDARIGGVTVDIMQGSKRLATVRTTSSGAFKASVKFSSKGTKAIRAVTRADARLLGGASPFDRIKVL